MGDKRTTTRTPSRFLAFHFLFLNKYQRFISKTAATIRQSSNQTNALIAVLSNAARCPKPTTNRVSDRFTLRSAWGYVGNSIATTQMR